MQLGIVYNLPSDVYHALPGHGSTSIRHAAQRSVAHARASRARPATAAMGRGTALHAALLEQSEWERTHLPVDEVACKGGAKGCSRTAVPGTSLCWQHGGREEAAAWAADHPGCVLVPRGEWCEIVDAARAIEAGVARTELPRLLHGGHREVSVAAVATLDDRGRLALRTDGEVGPGDLVVRGRIDLLHDRVACDFKTTTTGVDPKSVRRSLEQYGWLVQASLYTSLLLAATGAVHEWLWLVAEAEAPHAVRIYRPDPDDLAEAAEEVELGVARWLDYREREDEWSGWVTGIETVSRWRPRGDE